MSGHGTKRQANDAVTRRSHFVRALWWRAPLVLVSIAVFIYFLYAIGMNFVVVAQMNQELAQLQEKLDEEHLRQEDLAREIELLEQDEYIEVIAREQLRMIRPGDIPFNWKPAR